MYEEIKKISSCFTSHRRTAVKPNACARVNAEIVLLLLFRGNLRRDTSEKQVMGQAATRESGCV